MTEAHIKMSWCGENDGDGRLINSCSLYSCLIWIPSVVYFYFGAKRYAITTQYLHFSSLDNKTGMLLFLMQLLCLIQTGLSLLLFFGSDETAYVLLFCCCAQALSWILCTIVTTRECWRLTRWPGKHTIWFLWCITAMNLLQLLTSNDDVVIYSANLVKCNAGLTAVSCLMLVIVYTKDSCYTNREKERLELDRVSVEIHDGYSRNDSLSQANGFMPNAFWGSSLFRRLLGKSDVPAKRGSSGGVSLKGWGSNNEEGYAVVGTDEEWDHTGEGERAPTNEAQSVVLSALDRHTLLNPIQQQGMGLEFSQYAPPPNGSFSAAPIVHDEEDTFLTLSSGIAPDNMTSLQMASSPPVLQPAGSSQAVKRAMQAQNDRIAAAAAALSPSFATSSASVSNRGKSRSLASSPSSTSSSAWAARPDKSTGSLGFNIREAKSTNAQLNTDYYSIIANKWGWRRQRLEGMNVDHDGDTDDFMDEIEFEIGISVMRSGSSHVGSAGDWSARATTIDASGSAGTQDEHWTVWRTGAEIMSLHSQLVIAHGESAVPRRPKLKSTQPPRPNPTTSSNVKSHISRSVSTDRLAPVSLLTQLSKDANSEAIAENQTTSPADIAADMRSISVYLTAVMAISNKSAHPNASTGPGGSVGVPAGGLSALFPALLLFLEIYVGGGSVRRSAHEIYTGNTSGDTSPRSPTSTRPDEAGTSASRQLTEENVANTLSQQRTALDDESERDNWRKLFNKLKSKVILQEQCVRCRMFPRVVRGSDVYNFLQVSNDGFLEEGQALKMGRKLIQCGLLRAVTVGHHGPSELQVAAIAAAHNGQSTVSGSHRADTTGDNSATEKEALHPSGAINAVAALLFANSPDYLYSYPENATGPTSSASSVYIFSSDSDDPSDRFILLGGNGMEVTITSTENAENSVRYCISLKHLGPKSETVDREWNSSGSDRWTVWRRYSDFDKLHTQLCALYVTPPASLPPKTLSVSSIASVASSVSSSAATVMGIIPKAAKSEEHVEQMDQGGTAAPNARRDGLQNYLQALVDYICSDAFDSPTSEVDGLSVDGGILSAFNSKRDPKAASEARLLLARFLDPSHDQLTIR